MTENNKITSIAKRYYKMSLWIIFGLTLIVLLTMQVASAAWLTNSLVISALFSLFSSIALIQAWKAVARRSPMQLGKFYLAAAALRMILAFIVVLIAVVVMRADKRAVVGFAAMFAGFYLAMLIYDCIFFSLTEKKNNI